jgi:hypothetical protein
MGRVITLSEQWRKKYEYHTQSLRPEPFKSEKLEIDYITLNISMKGEMRSRKYWTIFISIRI